MDNTSEAEIRPLPIAAQGSTLMKEITKHNIYMRNWIAFRSHPVHRTVSFWGNFADVFTYPTDIESEKKFTEDMFSSPFSEDMHHLRTYFIKAMDDVDIEDEDSAIHAIR